MCEKSNRCGDELLVDDDDRRANCDSCREKMRVRKANSRARETLTTTMAARDNDDFLSLVDDSDIVVGGSNRRNSNRDGMFLSARIGERNINPSSTSATSSQLRAHGEEQRLRLTVQQSASMLCDTHDSMNRDSERKAVIVKDLAKQTERTEIVESTKERAEHAQRVEYSQQLTTQIEQIYSRYSVQLHEATLSYSRAMQQMCEQALPTLTIDLPQQIRASVAEATRQGYESASREARATVERVKRLRREAFLDARVKEADARQQNARRIANGQPPVEWQALPSQYDKWSGRWKDGGGSGNDERETLTLFSSFGLHGRIVDDCDDGDDDYGKGKRNDNAQKETREIREQRALVAFSQCGRSIVTDLQRRSIEMAQQFFDIAMAGEQTMIDSLQQVKVDVERLRAENSNNNEEKENNNKEEK